MVTLSKFDSVDYLDSDEAISEYLIAALECGDEAHTKHCLADAAKAKTINQLAKETGIDRAELCRMFADDGEDPVPEPESRLNSKVARAFAAHAGA
jgi:probable addiction module antidote protein